VHRFAEPVIRRAGNKCQVSRVEAVELLQACHIKPWSESEDSERLDPNNGVCLAAHVHAAFDAQLIGIKPDGEVVYSDHLSADDRRRLNLPEFVRLEVLSDQRRYLAYRFDKYTRTQELES
jgi:predicted restriction endonuclease